MNHGCPDFADIYQSGENYLAFLSVFIREIRGQTIRVHSHCCPEKFCFFAHILALLPSLSLLAFVKHFGCGFAAL